VRHWHDGTGRIVTHALQVPGLGGVQGGTVQTLVPENRCCGLSLGWSFLGVARDPTHVNDSEFFLSLAFVHYTLL